MAKQSAQYKVQNTETTKSVTASNNMTINEANASETDDLMKQIEELKSKMDEIDSIENSEEEISEVEVENETKQQGWDEIVESTGTVKKVNFETRRRQGSRVMKPDRMSHSADPPDTGQSERDESSGIEPPIMNENNAKFNVKQSKAAVNRPLGVIRGVPAFGGFCFFTTENTGGDTG